MSMITKKYNETDMLTMLNKLLIDPDEYIEAAVYCVFKGTGFVESGDTFTGYAAITNKNRFIGYKMALLNTVPILFNMDHLQKIKISKNIFGHNVIYMEFKLDQIYKIKYNFSSKVYGAKFPNQGRNAEVMLGILKDKQNILNLEM